MENAQKKLHKERKRVGEESLVITEENDVVNAVARDAKMDKLMKKIRELSEEVSLLRDGQSQHDSPTG